MGEFSNPISIKVQSGVGKMKRYLKIVFAALIISNLALVSQAEVLKTRVSQDRSVTDLGTLGGGTSSAIDINEKGQVVGWSYNSSGDEHAFLWKKGTMIDLGTLPDDTRSVANGINNQGQVVGASYAYSGDEHAFIWDNGVMTDLGTLSGRMSLARGINNHKQVVGWSYTSSGDHAFIWDNGIMTDLGTLGGNEADAYEINNRGQVVGMSTLTSGEAHATLWEIR